MQPTHQKKNNKKGEIKAGKGPNVATNKPPQKAN